MPQYTLGPSRWRKLPRPRTKPDSIRRETRDSEGNINLSRDSGSGYERFRSKEVRPDTPREGSEDAYVSHHRLLSVVWCYPDEMEVSEILEHLEGRDVHHTLGVEWCNIGSSPNFSEPGLVVRGHGRHSEITQAEMRAWAEDDKERAHEPRETATDSEVCGGCGQVCETPARSRDWEGVRCLSCTKVDSQGSPIEVVG